jgi:hypothetical protein
LPALANRPNAEGAAEYIAALRKALAENDPDGRVVANFRFLQTEPKLQGGGQ